jgi:hypothetical protein
MKIFEYIKALFRVGDYISKTLSLETDLLKLRLEHADLVKRVTELEKTSQQVKEQINASSQTKPFPPTAKNVIYQGGLLWADNDKMPVCSHCYDTKGLAVHLSYDGEELFLCPACKTSYRYFDNAPDAVPKIRWNAA